MKMPLTWALLSALCNVYISQNRQVVLDSLDNVFSTPRDIAGNVQLANSIEQS